MPIDFSIDIEFVMTNIRLSATSPFAAPMCSIVNLRMLLSTWFLYIEEMRFFDNGGPNLHTHICVFIRQNFLTMKTYV